MITKDIDGNALSAPFITKLQSQSNIPLIRFTVGGSDYDEYVQKVGTIHRDDQLNTGVCMVKVSNADDTWSALFYDDLTNMGAAASISLYWSGDAEYMPLMTGVVFDVKFRDPDCYIYIKDRFSNLLKHPLGSGQNPLEKFSVSQTPPTLVWDILTDEGGLDDTANDTNTDIDWDSFTQWAAGAWMSDIDVRARFTGQSIRSALLTVARLTTSMIWMDNTGKFRFAPNFTTGETMTVSTFLKLDIDISMENLINNYDVYYGYDPAVPGWGSGGVYNGNDAGSESDYGATTHVIEDRTVWHDDAASAEAGSDVFLAKYADPLVVANIACPSLNHFRTDVGDLITVTQAFKGISSDTFRLQAVDLDLSGISAKFRGYTAAAL